MEWVHCHIARQPVPPAERLNDLPVPLSAIVSKLLAKPAEERYQTATGVESDLRRCLAQWELDRRIEQQGLAHSTSRGAGEIGRKRPLSRGGLKAAKTPPTIWFKEFFARRARHVRPAAGP